MRQGKRPTRTQKIRIKSHGLNPDNWLVVKGYKDILQIMNKASGKTRVLREVK